MIYIIGMSKILIVITFMLLYAAGFSALEDYNSDQTICAVKTNFDYRYWGLILKE